MPRVRMGALLAVLAALSLGLAACGGDDDGPIVEIEQLSGESTEVVLDKGFVDALGTLGLTPGVVGDAKFGQKGAAVSFPITGGNFSYYGAASDVRPYVQGLIVHKGSGLSLEAGGTTVELTNFTIDPGTSKLMGMVTANGEVAAERAVLFDLDGSTLEPLRTSFVDGTGTLTGTKVELSAPAAELLNATFETDALAGGFLIGVSTITVDLPE